MNLGPGICCWAVEMDLPKRTQEGGEAGETRVMQSGFDGGHLESSPDRWQRQGEEHGFGQWQAPSIDEHCNCKQADREGLSHSMLVPPTTESFESFL